MVFRLFLSRYPGRRAAGILAAALVLGGAVAGAAPSKSPPPRAAAKPRITIASVPSVPPGEGSWGTITGTVRGVDVKSCYVVVVARGDTWYVQPWANDCRTTINADGKWSSGTHGGWEFAALLVKGKYEAPATLDALPKIGGPILAIARATPKK